MSVNKLHGEFYLQLAQQMQRSIADQLLDHHVTTHFDSARNNFGMTECTNTNDIETDA